MASVRRFVGRRALVVVALALLAVGGAVAVLDRPRPSADLRPDPDPVLDLPDGEIVGGVAVGESVVVVLSQEMEEEEEAAGRDRTTLIRLDPQTGAEQARVVLGPWSAMDEVAEVDGDLVLRLRGRLPGVPGILLPASASDDLAPFDAGVWLVVVDGSTLAPVRQYQLPPFRISTRSAEVVEPLVIVDGVYWMLGASSWRARIDLRSGEAWFARDVFARVISGVIELDGRLVVVAWGIVRVIETGTGDIAARYQATDFPAMMTDFQPVDFRVHENQVWAAPLVRDVDDLPRRLDLETGMLVDVRPSTPIPGLAFESGGSRWELIGRRVVPVEPRRPIPEPGDRWRQVVPETNQVVAVVDLGSWQPIFATPGDLWVTGDGDDGPGAQLARISLEPLSGGS